MSVSVARPYAVSETRAAVREGAVPWYLTAVTLASTSVIVGLLWDISWHRTIGRDTFLTPAHVAIYLGAVIAGIACGTLALKTTFAGNAFERGTSVSFWGFRAPLGAWVCIWGSFAMLTSAPFDNWWHNAYGLDVQILSPPHVVLGLGMIGIQIGAMLMVLAHQNRNGDVGGPLRWMFVYCAGIALLMVATMVWEYTGFANQMHSALFYRVAAIALPAFMIAPARAGKLSWPATAVALVYMGLTLAMAWVLPLFPASAKLAPIYNPVTHMVPPTFPLLLVVPALCFDLLLRRAATRREWALALMMGPLFVLTLLAVQWPFSEFLISPAARNAVFVADRWDYNTQLGPWQYRYWSLDRDAHGVWSAGKFWSGIGLAIAVAVVTSWIGLVRGRWMRDVRR
jgi:hypothetical protein